ncbi:MAG: hypothetical protein O2960_29020 [Verrucomicrobia bacterium]|nr:hypothetical protein [Verrucomicrobiota bacterium]
MHSKAQEQLPDTGVAETFDGFPYTADQVAVTCDLGQFLCILLPRQAKTRIDSRHWMAGHAGKLLTIADGRRHAAWRRGRLR